MPWQNTFIRQMNNFLYPSFVQLISESVVAVGNENTILLILWWKQLCASRPGAILEFLVISRQLLQLEITSSSLEKQMFHTVENTQVQTPAGETHLLVSGEVSWFLQVSCIQSLHITVVCFVPHVKPGSVVRRKRGG